MIDKLAIIGTGLIGCSFALALKQAQLCRQIVGYDTNVENRVNAEKIGAIDCAVVDLSAVANADVILFALPINFFAETLTELQPHLMTRTILTDVISVKSAVVQIAETILGAQSCQFVAGHPIAGSEKTGALAAKANLFADRNVILTPTTKTAPAAIETIKKLWLALATKVTIMTAEMHDEILATTSHLPHVLAFAYMYAFMPTHIKKSAKYCIGPSFLDFSRIAAANADLWTNICLGNQQHLVAKLTELQQQLAQFKQALQTKDAVGLKQLIANAQAIKDEISR